MSPELKVEVVPIEQIKPTPNNTKQHPENQVKQIADSIREFGFNDPIGIDGQGWIIEGHGRYLAAQQLGLKTLPIIRLNHLTPAQQKAYMIAHNKLTLNSDFDFTLLKNELELLLAKDFDLSLTGFGQEEIDALLGTEPAGGLTDDDDVPDAPKEAVTRTGDVWLLGAHRVLCGDSTKAEDVGKLMAGGKADMVFTDPPYGVDYDGGTKVREKLSGDGDTSLYSPCCFMAAEFSDKAAALYLWHAGIKGIAAAAAAAAAGYEIRCEIVWNKNQAQFGALSAQYKQKHEPLYYCYKRNAVVRWFGPTNEVTVWDCDRASINDFHPTQKPVELAERAIGNSSKKGDSILDLFGGSGSTLIASEKLGRRCRMLEISENYTDVICQRWMAYTGKEATLEGDGRSFTQIKEERLNA